MSQSGDPIYVKSQSRQNWSTYLRCLHRWESYKEKQGNVCHEGLDTISVGACGAGHSYLLPWVVTTGVFTLRVLFILHKFLYVFSLWYHMYHHQFFKGKGKKNKYKAMQKTLITCQAVQKFMRYILSRQKYFLKKKYTRIECTVYNWHKTNMYLPDWRGPQTLTE